MTIETESQETDISQRVVETQKTRLGGFIGLMLLMAFFTPYVLKLPQLDITLILIGGMVLAVFDFFSAHNG